MFAELKDVWVLLLGLVGVTGWLVRMEARVNAAHADILRLGQQRHEDLAAARDARTETNARLHEVQDQMRALRDDVKTLLERTK